MTGKFISKKMKILSAVGMAIAVVECIYPLVYAEWIRIAVNDIQTGGKNLLSLVLFVIPLVLIQLLLIWGEREFGTFLYNRFCVSLRSVFLDKLIKSEMLPLSTFDAGSIMTRFRQDINVISSFYAADLPRLVSIAFSFVLGCVYVCNISLIYLPFCMIPALSAFFLLKKVRARQKDIFAASSEVSEQLDNFYSDIAKGYTDIKQFGAESAFWNKGEALTGENSKNAYSAGKLQGQIAYISMLSHSLTSILILALGVLFVYLGVGKIGDCVAIYSVFYMIANPIRNFAKHLSVRNKMTVSKQRMREFFSLPEEKTTSDSLPETSGKALPLDVHIDSFSYGGDYVLPSVNFSVEPKSYTVVLGASGSGKTTLAKLLVGYSNDYSGTISFYGCDVRKLSAEFLRENVIYVANDHWVPDGTIAELFGLNRRIDINRLNKILDIVELGEYVRAQPEGINTYVEENAKNLSGGERQRLLLALACSMEADVYILDEMTSALETEQSLRIISSIRALHSESSFIQITHNTCFSQFADQTVFVDRTCTYTGRHTDLMKNCNSYAGFNGEDELC